MRGPAFSTLGCPNWSLEQALARGREYGYMAIELRLVDGKLIEDSMSAPERARRLAGGLQATGRGVIASVPAPAAGTPVPGTVPRTRRIGPRRRSFSPRRAEPEAARGLGTDIPGAKISAAPTGGIGGGGGAAITGPVSLSVQVSKYPELANVGGIAEVDNGGTPVAAVRTGASSFAAFSLICPHFGCTVGINGSAFLCPCHGAQFASTGRWIGGQQTTNLTSLGTSYNATTGVLTITN